MQDFTRQLMGMQALFHRQLMRSLDKTQISAGQPKVLAYLKSHEGQCQKDIAQACLMEPGSLTVLLNRMEKQGMVERRSLGGNRKSRSIFLTPYGAELAKTVVDAFYSVEELAFQGISEEDQAQFAAVCEKIAKNLMLE